MPLASRPIRVLHCIWRMGSGGAERQLAFLSSGLIADGFENHAAFVYPGENSDRLRATGTVLHRIDAAHKYDIRVLPRLFAIARRLKPDVIHTWLAQMDIAGGITAELLRVPWVLSERSAAENYPLTLLYAARALVGRRASVIVANSAGGALYWQRKVDNATIRVIDNGVAVGAIEKAVTARGDTLGIADDEIVILHVGRLSAEKNLESLIDAMWRLVGSRPAHLVLCGDGPLEAPLRTRTRERGLESRVHFAGFVDDVWSWLRRANVYVSVSRHEGHPNATLEAMAASVPIVLSDMPAHRAIADETSSIFVPLDGVEAIAEGLNAALRGDGSVRERVAAARRRVERYSLKRMVSEYEAVYRELTARRCG